MSAMQSFLKFISFENLENWSVKDKLNKNKFSSSYKIVKLSYVLDDLTNQRKIKLLDDVEYQEPTISSKTNTIIVRKKAYGKDFKVKNRIEIKRGDLVIAKLHTQNGLFAFANDYFTSTTTFIPFAFDNEKITKDYLFLILKICLKYLSSNDTVGRETYKTTDILNLKIPLPSPKQQEEILQKYNAKIELAKQQEQEAKEIEESIEEYFNTQIGIEVNSVEEKSNSFLSFINYMELEKWGVDKNLTQSNIKYTKKFPIKTIKDLCQIGSGGTPSRSHKEYYTGNIPWIKTGEVVNDIIYDTEEKITQEAIDKSSAKLYLKDSLIIAMYGQGLTRGRTAKLGVDATTNQACAVLYNIDNTIIDTDYLWFYMMNEYHRLRALASGNNQPNLNAEMIKNYKVVIPDLKLQKEIVEEIIKRKEKIKQLKQEAQKNREEAIKEFEREIFDEA